VPGATSILWIKDLNLKDALHLLRGHLARGQERLDKTSSKMDTRDSDGLALLTISSIHFHFLFPFDGIIDVVSLEAVYSDILRV
jgi:hypothetical protein